MEGILVFFVHFIQSYLLFLQYLQLFPTLKNQLAHSRKLQSITNAQKDRRHYTSVVVCQLRSYQIRPYRKCQQAQDEEVNAVVPPVSKGFAPLREVPQQSELAEWVQIESQHESDGNFYDGHHEEVLAVEKNKHGDGGEDLE